MSNDPRIARLTRFFETLTPESVARIGMVYADDARFKDPFNDVRGIAQIQRVFDHMFEQVNEPRFIVTRAMCDGDDAFLTWEFVFRLKRPAGQTETIRGATHIQFARDGRVAVHRDYWDAAEELYEKLPLLGGLMRFIKRRASR
jgi:ketosteroid isomerase-like protein